MKYLKRFNENNKEEDIKDILLDLEDNGITYSYNNNSSNDYLKAIYFIETFLTIKYDESYKDLILETINRLADYLDREYLISDTTNSNIITPIDEYDFEYKQSANIVIIFYEKMDLYKRGLLRRGHKIKFRQTPHNILMDGEVYSYHPKSDKIDIKANGRVYSVSKYYPGILIGRYELYNEKLSNSTLNDMSLKLKHL